jgi:hypothetical protein
VLSIKIFQESTHQNWKKKISPKTFHHQTRYGCEREIFYVININLNFMTCWVHTLNFKFFPFTFHYYGKCKHKKKKKKQEEELLERERQFMIISKSTLFCSE